MPRTGKPEAAAPPPERLQKVMAAAGLGSRRALEKRIEAGEISINGRTARLGAAVAAGDTVAQGERSWRVIEKASRHRTLIYNKPEGEVTSRSDPDGRPTVFDRLPPVADGRWVAIGRLDINTTGLLLLTTDGELANTMMHPSSNVDREYACRIRGRADEEQLQRLKSGVQLEDGPASFSDIQEAGGSGENHWYHVTIMEGRNREVRRLWESQGLTVSRLKRVRYGAAFLPRRLRMGQWSEITAREHAILREDVGLPGAARDLALEELRPRGGKRPGKGRGRAQHRSGSGGKPGSSRSRSSRSGSSGSGGAGTGPRKRARGKR